MIMDIKQLKKSKKNYELVADELILMIREQQLKPGDRIDSVETLAFKFNVSRSAIREALSALRAMGLIEIRHGDGTFVHSTDFSQMSIPLSASILTNRDELLEFLQVRKIIESSTALITAEKRKQEHLDEMNKALVQMKKAVQKEDLGEQADVRFHLAIATATGNSLLVKLVHQITDTLRDTMKETRHIWLFGEQASVERLYQEHLSIYNAIVDQNGSLAQQLMLDHLTKVEKVLIQFDPHSPQNI